MATCCVCPCRVPKVSRNKLTWWCHRCDPGRTSGCVPACCRPRPPRPRSTPPLSRRCSTGCCDTGDLCSRGSTPASAGSAAPSYPPCWLRDATLKLHEERKTNVWQHLLRKHRTSPNTVHRSKDNGSCSPSLSSLELCNIQLHFP